MDAEIKALLQKAVQPGPERLFAGAVFAATNTDGSLSTVNPAGTLSLSTTDPVADDTVAWVASLTKLLTVIAVMQLVESGVVSLDSHEEVARILPEIAAPDLITDFDPATSAFKIVKASRSPTLRELLTHSSGFAYDILNPALRAWRASRGEGFRYLDRDILDAYNLPLVCEPGTGWFYGPGLDWAGKLVERLAGKTLKEYFQAHIGKPLGMSTIAFHIENEPDLQPRLLRPCSRPFANPVLGDGAISTSLTPPGLGGDDRGGVGLYTTAPDYLKVLQALLKNDGTLLKPDTVDMMFLPQCTGQVKEAFRVELTGRYARSYCPGLPPGTADLNQSLASAVLESDVSGIAREGAAFWNGIPNCSWMLDRQSGYAAVFLCSHTPAGYPEICDLISSLFKAVQKSQFA